MRHLLKNKVLVGTVMLLLIAAVCLLPIPKKMNITQEGVLWRCGAPEESRTTTVKVAGTYWDDPFGQDDFKGTVWVEELPETHGEISLTNLGDNQYGIWYEAEDALLKAFGGLFLRQDGSVLMLIHEDGHWSADTGLVLTAPASTRAEAVRLANELAKELSPNWLGTCEFQ